MTRVRESAHKTVTETAYYLFGRPLTAHPCNPVARTHLGVENGLHGCLDVQIDEVPSRTGCDYAPQNLSILRHMALNVMRKDPRRLASRKVQDSRLEQRLSHFNLSQVLKRDCPDGLAAEEASRYRAVGRIGSKNGSRATCASGQSRLYWLNAAGGGFSESLHSIVNRWWRGAFQAAVWGGYRLLFDIVYLEGMRGRWFALCGLLFVHPEFKLTLRRCASDGSDLSS